MEVQENGIYPVRILRDKILQWLNIIGDSTTIEDEIKYNGLSNRFKYKITNNIISDIAEINSLNQIIVYENFCQFLWSFTYAVIVIFDEAFIRPRKENNFNFKESKRLGVATKILETAFELFSNPKPCNYYNLPNPESKRFSKEIQVQATEDVYCIGMSFILLHEFGHHFLGHTFYQSKSANQSKKEEEDADYYAFSVISIHFNKDFGETAKVGIIISLISLIFIDDTLSGGGTHPDPHQRVKRVIENMKIDDNHNLWALAAIAFKL
jgi:hypothetical protein